MSRPEAARRGSAALEPVRPGIVRQLDPLERLAQHELRPG